MSLMDFIFCVECKSRVQKTSVLVRILIFNLHMGRHVEKQKAIFLVRTRANQSEKCAFRCGSNLSYIFEFSRQPLKFSSHKKVNALMKAVHRAPSVALRTPPRFLFIRSSRLSPPCGKNKRSRELSRSIYEKHDHAPDQQIAAECGKVCKYTPTPSNTVAR